MTRQCNFTPGSHCARARRGGAIIYILIMVVAIAAVVLVCAEFGMATVRHQLRYEDQIALNYAFEGICAKIDADAAAGSISTLPASYTVNQNGVSGTITVSDNSANIANSMLASGTLTATDGRTYPVSAVLAKQVNATPFWYALFVNNNLTSTGWTFYTGSGGSNGDIFANGTISITGHNPAANNVINGNVQATGSTITLTTVSATGTQTKNASPITFTTPVGANYLAVASATSSNNNLAGYTFGSVSGGSPYPVLYCSAASINVSGSFSGTGTVYFNGNVTVNGAMSYANGSSKVAFVVNGNLTTNGQTLVGYWYVNGTTSSGGATLTDTNGALITRSFSSGAPVNLVLDTTVKNSVTTGNLLHLPGYTWNTNDILAGTYIGTYTVNSGDSGTMNMTVANDGTVTGTLSDVTLGSGTIAGTLTSYGSFTGTETAGGYLFTASGSLTLSGTTLSGTLNISNASWGNYTQTVTLTKQ